MPDVVSFYELIARKLAAEAQMATKWISDKHWGAVGASREAALVRFIRSYLPERVVCGTGFIVGQDGALSRQCDLLIYERGALAPLFVEEDFVVVRADAVRLVIEAKSGVNAEVFRVALNNIRCAKRLNDRIRGGIFALTGPESKDKAKNWLHSISKYGVPGPKSDKASNDELPAEHLADFMHFADGLQLHASRSEEDGLVHVGARKFRPNDGKALLYLWDWILTECRPPIGLGVEPIPYLLEYLRMPMPKWPELMVYQSHYQE